MSRIVVGVDGSDHEELSARADELLRKSIEPVPFAAGAAADRLAGSEVADEVIAAFVDGITARLEALIPPEDVTLEDGESLEEVSDASTGRSRILITLDQLADHRGGAVALTRQLAGTPGVTHAEVNPLAGIATVEYDPDAGPRPDGWDAFGRAEHERVQRARRRKVVGA
jgi:hypothetical protein